MSETKSYSSPVSYTRATPALYSLVSARKSWWGITLAWVLFVPVVAVLWALLACYYALALTVGFVPFVVWRLMRRSDRKHAELIDTMKGSEHRGA
jgi:hypothetical protein